MPKLRYLVLSDLHLGAANSILTQLTPDLKGTAPHLVSDVLKQLALCIRELCELNDASDPVRLILNGDFMELALSGTNDASMCFTGFIKEIFGPAPSPRIQKGIYCLPGNHDHHLWNTARESQYVDTYLAKAPPEEYLAPEHYVTHMFEDENLKPIPANLLNTVIHRFDELKDLHFETIYPNFGVLNPERTRCVIFHHGHYVEPIYSLMTHLKETLFPDHQPSPDIAELEAENGAWIDFFWSTLGRSGQVGADVELIYDKLQDPHQFHAILGNLAKAFASKGWLSSVKRPLYGAFLSGLFAVFAHREPHKTDDVLSEQAKEGLTTYLERYLLPEIQRGNNETVPPEVTFIFGHTHKPFENRQRFNGYPGETMLLNSGGWVVDTLEPHAIFGASIILVDEELNTAAVRMYRQVDASGNDPSVCVTSVPGSGSALADQLTELIKADAEPWKTFTDLTQKAIADHRQNLRFKVQS